MNPCRYSAHCLNRALNSVTCVAVASVLSTRAGHMPSAMFLKENHDNMKTLRIDIKTLYGQGCACKAGMSLEKKMAKFSIFWDPSPSSCLHK